MDSTLLDLVMSSSDVQRIVDAAVSWKDEPEAYRPHKRYRKPKAPHVPKSPTTLGEELSEETRRELEKRWAPAMDAPAEEVPTAEIPAEEPPAAPAKPRKDVPLPPVRGLTLDLSPLETGKHETKKPLDAPDHSAIYDEVSKILEPLAKKTDNTLALEETLREALSGWFDTHEDFADMLADDPRKATKVIGNLIDELRTGVDARFSRRTTEIATRVMNDLIKEKGVVTPDMAPKPLSPEEQHKETRQSDFLQRMYTKENVKPLSRQQLWDLFSIRPGDKMDKATVDRAVNFFLGRQESPEADKKYRFKNKWVRDLIKEERAQDPNKTEDSILKDYLTRFYGYVKNIAMMSAEDTAKVSQLDDRFYEITKAYNETKSGSPEQQDLLQQYNQLSDEYEKIVESSKIMGQEEADDVFAQKLNHHKNILIGTLLRQNKGSAVSQLVNSGAFTATEATKRLAKLDSLKIVSLNDIMSAQLQRTGEMPELEAKLDEATDTIVDQIRKKSVNILDVEKMRKMILTGGLAAYLKSTNLVPPEKIAEYEKVLAGLKLERDMTKPVEVAGLPRGLPLEQQPPETQKAINYVLEKMKFEIDSHNEIINQHYNLQKKRKPQLQFPESRMLNYEALKKGLLQILLGSDAVKEKTAEDTEKKNPWEEEKKPITPEEKAEMAHTKAKRVRQFLLSEAKIKNPSLLDRLTEMIRNIELKTGKPDSTPYLDFDKQPEAPRKAVDNLVEKIQTDLEDFDDPKNRATVKNFLIKNDEDGLKKFLSSRGISPDARMIPVVRAYFSDLNAAGLHSQPEATQRFINDVVNEVESNVDPMSVLSDYNWILQLPIDKLADIDVKNSKVPEDEPGWGTDVKIQLGEIGELRTQLEELFAWLRTPEMHEELDTFQGFTVDENMKVNEEALAQKLDHLADELRKTPLTPEQRQKFLRVDVKSFDIKMGIDPAHLVSLQRTREESTKQLNRHLAKNVYWMARKHFTTPSPEVNFALQRFDQITQLPQMAKALDKESVMRSLEQSLAGAKAEAMQNLKGMFHSLWKPDLLRGPSALSSDATMKKYFVQFIKNPESFAADFVKMPPEVKSPDLTDARAEKIDVVEPEIGYKPIKLPGGPEKTALQKIIKNAIRYTRIYNFDPAKYNEVVKFLGDNLDYTKIPAQIAHPNLDAGELQELLEEQQKASEEHDFLSEIVVNKDKYKSLIDAYSDLYALYKSTNYNFKILTSSSVNPNLYEAVDKWKEFVSGVEYLFNKPQFKAIWNSKSPGGWMFEVEGQRIKPGKGEQVQFSEDALPLKERADFLNIDSDEVLQFLRKKLQDMYTPGGKAFGPRFEEVKDAILKRVRAIDRFVETKLDPNKIYLENRTKLRQNLLRVERKLREGTDVKGPKFTVHTASSLLKIRDKIIDLMIKFAARKSFRKQRNVPLWFYNGKHIVRGPGGTAMKQVEKPFFFRPDHIDNFVQTLENYGMDFTEDLADPDKEVDPARYEPALDKSAVMGLALATKNVDKNFLKDKDINDEAVRARLLEEGLLNRSSMVMAEQLIDAGKAEPALKREIEDALKAKARLHDLVPTYNAALSKNHGELKQLDELAQVILNPHQYVQKVVQGKRSPLYDNFLADTELSPDEQKDYDRKLQEYEKRVSPLKDRGKFNAFVKKMLNNKKNYARPTDKEYKAMRVRMHQVGVLGRQKLREYVGEIDYAVALTFGLVKEIEDQSEQTMANAKKDPFLKTKDGVADANFYRHAVDALLERIVRDKSVSDATKAYLDDPDTLIELGEQGVTERRQNLKEFDQAIKEAHTELVRVSNVLRDIESATGSHMSKVWEEVKPLINVHFVDDSWSNGIRKSIDDMNRAVKLSKPDEREKAISDRTVKKNDVLKEIDRQRTFLNRSDEKLEALRKKALEMSWPDPGDEYQVNSWLQAATENLKHNHKLIDGIEEYLNLEDPSIPYAELRAFLKRFHDKYRAIPGTATPAPRDISKEYTFLNVYKNLVDRDLGEKVKAGERGKSVDDLQKLKQEIMDDLSIVRDMGTMVPGIKGPEITVREGIIRDISERLGFLTNYIVAADPIAKFRTDNEARKKQMERDYQAYRTKKSEGIDVEDPSLEYMNELRRMRSDIERATNSMPSFERYADALPTEEEKRNIKEIVERIKEYLPKFRDAIYDIAVKAFPKMEDFKAPLTAKGVRPKLASWTEITAEDDEDSKPSSVHDIITETKAGPGEEELLPSTPRIRQIDILREMAKDGRKSFLGMSELYDFLLKQRGSETTAEVVQNLMRHLKRKVRNLEHYADLPIPTSMGDIKLKDVGRTFEDKLDGFLGKLSHMRSQIAIDQNLIDKIEGKMREYHDFFVDLDYDDTGTGDDRYLKRGETFLGWTPAEKKSMMNVFYANLFYDLMFYWNKQVGKDVVFGERWMPKFKSIYDTLKNYTDRVIKTDPVISEQLHAIDDAMRAPFDEVRYRKEKKRLTAEGNDLVKLYEDIGEPLVSKALNQKDPNVIKKEIDAADAKVAKLDKQYQAGDKSIVPALRQAKIEARMYRRMYPQIVESIRTGQPLKSEVYVKGIVHDISDKISYIESQEKMRKVLMNRVGEMMTYKERVAQLQALRTKLVTGTKEEKAAGTPAEQMDYDVETLNEIDKKITEFGKKASEEKTRLGGMLVDFFKSEEFQNLLKKHAKVGKDVAIDMGKMAPAESTPMPTMGPSPRPGIVTAAKKDYTKDSSYNAKILYGSLMQKTISEMALSKAV